LAPNGILSKLFAAAEIFIEFMQQIDFKIHLQENIQIGKI
jgi:hypothetical protein